MTPPPPIVIFEDHMDAASQLSGIAKLEKPWVWKEQIGTQKDGEVIQESYFIRDLKGAELILNHALRAIITSLYLWGLQIGKTLQINEQVCKAYTTAMVKWNTASTNRRPQKSKVIGHINQ